MERKEKIENYLNGHQELKDALYKIPQEVWQYKPSPTEWSVHEIIIHIADSETNACIRLKKIISEPDTVAPNYDQGQWAENLPYHQMSIDLALELLGCLRRQNCELLNLVEDSKWENKLNHKASGGLTIDKWLDMYINHITSHIGQMNRNYKNWQKSKNN